jgi:hypothetical protein
MNSPKRPAKQPQPQAPPQIETQVQVQAQPQPVVPPRPDQMAPVAPQVTYQNGHLTILAQNSTLSSILSAVRARTGAQVDMPPDTANDRVAVQLGPGNPRDVMASLLQGSRFDYIVIGSATDPDALSQVILTTHPGSGTASQSTQGGNPQPAMPPTAGVAARPETPGDEDETAVEPQPLPQALQSPQPQGETGAPPPGMVQPPGYPSLGSSPGVDPSQQQNPNQVKTPEQLLQDLQRMQQQQQQQRQGAKLPQ